MISGCKWNTIGVTMTLRRWNLGLAGSLIAIGISTPGLAADLVEEPLPEPVPYVVQSEWEAVAAAYAWGAGLSGDIAVVGLPPVDVDISFGEALNYLDFAAMAAGQVRYDGFGVFVDLVYLKLSGAAATPLGIIADRVSLGQQITIATMTGTYDVSQWENLRLEAMVGIRVWSVQTTLSVSGGRRNLALFREQQDTWVDPLLGMQARYDINDRWYVTGWGMASGFGASSDFGWDALGAVGYEINDRFSLAAGYRGAGVDYTNGDFVWDVTMHGPVIGAVLRF
jgi:hypothetical protein